MPDLTLGVALVFILFGAFGLVTMLLERRHTKTSRDDYRRLREHWQRENARILHDSEFQRLVGRLDGRP